MQTLLRQNSFSSDLVANTSIMRDQERTQREEHDQEREKEGENQAMRDKSSSLNMGLERERIQDRMSEQLQQTRSRSASPARSAVFFKEQSCTFLKSKLGWCCWSPTHQCIIPLLCLPHRLDSLVQSQARELSQLRQQIKDSHRLGAMHHQQLEELRKAFKELLQAGEVDCYMGEVVKEQLDKSLGILDRLEGRLDKGSWCTNCSGNQNNLYLRKSGK